MKGKIVEDLVQADGGGPLAVENVTLTLERLPWDRLRITSDDLPGLLLCSADRDAVYRDLGKAIFMLLKNRNARVTADPIAI